MDTLSPRERFARTMQHRPADRMLRTIDTGASEGIAGPYMDIFRTATGAANPPDYFDYDIRAVSAPLTAAATDFTAYHKEIPPNTVMDEFGVGWIKSPDFPMGAHLSPWRGFTAPNQVYDYPFPSFQVKKDIVAKIRDLKARGYVVSAFCGAINEYCYFMRSMEEFLMDLVLQQDVAEAIISRVSALCRTMGIQMTEAGADIVCFYGDVGGQSNLLMTPEMYRKWIKPRWEEIFAAVHRINPKVKVFLHSCGNIVTIKPPEEIPALVRTEYDHSRAKAQRPPR